VRDLAELEKTSLFQVRILEALREVGILLMAFAPLDGALSSELAEEWPDVLGFLVAGFLLFLYSMLGERRLRDDT
jgi:4-hydroxybenzoate polyprenyltransferase